MAVRSPALFSDWSPSVALFAGALICVVVVLHRVLGMPTALALNLFLVGFGIAALAIVFAIVALIDVWVRDRDGASSALFGIVIAACTFAWPLSFAQKFFDLPMMHEATTDPTSPPSYKVLAATRPPDANSTIYPIESFGRLQLAAYPDLRPIYVNRSPSETYEIALETIKRMRLKIVSETPPDSGRHGLIEAVDRTLVVGFYDDVVVRVSQVDHRARIDVRSSSRYGAHDLGRNATRLRDILTRMQARIAASVTTPSQRFARIKSRLSKVKRSTKRRRTGRHRRSYRRSSRRRAR